MEFGESGVSIYKYKSRCLVRDLIKIDWKVGIRLKADNRPGGRRQSLELYF